MQEIVRIKKEGGMQFSYIAGSEAEQYEFVRIPKTLISSDYFAGLSNPSRILYGLLFDRMSASPKNRWLDSEGHVYVVYPVPELTEDLHLSERKVKSCLLELEKIGLIERRKQGRGFPNRIYVRNFLPASNHEV